MKRKSLVVGFFCLAGTLWLASSAVGHPDKKHAAPSRFTEVGPIAVSVRRVDGQLEYQLDEKKYSKRGLNFQLAELKLDSQIVKRPVVVLLDDSTYLSDIRLVPKMAIDAGFTDIRVYAVWPRTGHMAEIVFGPVTKISANPDAN